MPEIDGGVSAEALVEMRWGWGVGGPRVFDASYWLGGEGDQNNDV
jgi:hypothetical protein